MDAFDALRMQNVPQRALVLEATELSLDPELAIERLMAIPEYIERFAAAFPEDPAITLENLAAAVSAFQRTVISDRSPYDAYLRGHLGALDGQLFPFL